VVLEELRDKEHSLELSHKMEVKTQVAVQAVLVMQEARLVALAVLV
jgi:hypothetical protein